MRSINYTGQYLPPAEELINAGTNERALRQLRSTNERLIYDSSTDPAEAYLRPGPPSIQNIHLALGFFFLVFAPAVMIFAWYDINTNS